MTPSAIQDAIVAALTVRYTAFKVEAHGGNFTERELPFLLNKAPVILVACAGFRSVSAYESVDRWRATLRFGLFVLGSDSSTTDRDDSAVNTVFDVLRWLPGQDWGLQESQFPDPESITADNLYTASTNNLRVALWGVAWNQLFQTLHLPA